MNDNKLKPCPFCGGEGEIIGGSENWSPTTYDPDSGGEPIAVICKSCECGLRYFDDYGDAIAAWNRRYQPPAHKYTLKDLRTFGAKGGKPLWLQLIPDNMWQSRYVLIGHAIQNNNLEDIGVALGAFGNSAVLYYSDYNKTWVAYDRPPEEEL